MEEQEDNLESLNQEEVVEPETTEVAEPETASAEDLKKAKDLANNQRIRAEKAEQELKALKKAPVEVAPKNEPMISLKDTKALMDVHDDDIDKLVGWAKFNNITIAEAKKTPEMQSYLKTQAELRQSAEAANTGSSKRAVSKVSDDVLLDQIAQGTLPEEDIEKAVKARLEQKKRGT